MRALQAEHEQQRHTQLSTLGERERAVETLEAQLSSVQAQLMNVLQAQLQQRDDVRKLASSGLVASSPLSMEAAEPPLAAPVPLPPSAKLVGEASELMFGNLAEMRDALKRRLGAPRRSVAQEFAQNEAGVGARVRICRAPARTPAPPPASVVADDARVRRPRPGG